MLRPSRIAQWKRHYPAHLAWRPIPTTCAVGASAPVEIVIVRGVPGEFVTGGWMATDANDRIQATAAPGTQVSLGVYWDPTLPQRILRWQEGNILYEILSTKTAQGITIDKDELIAMAESIE